MNGISWKFFDNEWVCLKCIFKEVLLELFGVIVCIVVEGVIED